MEFTKENYTAKEIVEAWEAGSLVRNPEYQRGEAWSQQQKQALIDSLFRKYPIPPLFLEKKIKPGLGGTTAEKHEIVDGQQRVLALASFFRDTFDLLAPADKQLRLPISMRDKPVSWAKCRYTTLGESLRTQLENTRIDVFMIEGVVSPDEVRDLFIRLQSGTALSRQQIRDAWPGNLGPYVEHIAGKLEKRPSLDLFSFVDGRGMRDDDSDSKDLYVKNRQTCAQILHILLTRLNDPTRIPSIQANDLDWMYHEYTNIDTGGDAINKINTILNYVEQVCKRIEALYTRKYKFPKQGLFALVLFFQDRLKNPMFKMDSKAITSLAKYITDSAPKPAGRSTSGPAIELYYEKWRDAMPEGIGVILDTKRVFDNTQKTEIRIKQDELCAVCIELVDEADAEYDHYPIPYRDGGPTKIENGRLVHAKCHPRGRPVTDD